jgi:predicted metal-dependent hydrolase
MKVETIKNGDEEIRCELKKRRNSKNLKMHIDSNGIVKVSLPYYTPYLYARKFVIDNLEWIQKKMEHFKLHKNKYYYLGNNIRLIKKFNANNKYFNYIESDSSLILETNDKSISIDELFLKFLKVKAMEYIPGRVEKLALKNDFKYNMVRIKNMTSTWGSCSAKKNLSFNLKLMYFNYKVIDYVIIHELCHLKFMNHSNKYWGLVESILPDYRIYKKILNN